MSRSNVEYVREAVALLAAGDLKRMARMAGSGSAEFVDTVRDTLESFGRVRIKVEDIIDRDDVVIVGLKISGTAKNSAQVLSIKQAQLWVMRDGAVEYARAFQTTEEAIAAAGIPQPPPPPDLFGVFERYGRFETGDDLDVRLELPGGEVRIAIVDYAATSRLEAFLDGPSGPVELERLPSQAPTEGRYQMFGIAFGMVPAQGRYRLQVQGLDSPYARTIIVGRSPEAESKGPRSFRLAWRK